MSGERSGKRKWDVGRVGCRPLPTNFLIDFLIRVLNILVQVVSAPDPRAWHMNLTIMECINPTNIYSKAP